MRKILLCSLLVLILYGCATTQKIPLSECSTYQLQAMLNETEADLEYYQYYQAPEQSNIQQTTNVYVNTSNSIGSTLTQAREVAFRQGGGTPLTALLGGIAKGFHQSQIRDLLYQRARILTELDKRRDNE